MPKLTDTQLVILSTAAARNDGAVLSLPDTLRIKGGAVNSVLKSLLKKQLIAERPAMPGAEVWRESDNGRMTLVITDAGLQAIGVTPEGEVAGAETIDKPAPRKSNRKAAQSKAATTPQTLGARRHQRHTEEEARSDRRLGERGRSRPGLSHHGGGLTMGRRAMLREGAAGDLSRDLAALPGLPLDVLKERWQALYGSPPPARLGRVLMVRGIAYRLQEQALGGLGPTTRRRLARAAEAVGAGRTPSPALPAIKPGTRLLREWQGVVHEVIVLENGVQYRGEPWKSLSAVAREITGTRWSGPLFFGLKERRDDRR
jgi:hypothetical protein